MKKRIALLISLAFFCAFPSVKARDFDNHWARETIISAMEKNLLKGTGDGNFEPDRNITRAEFVSLLINYSNITSDALYTSFTDISPTAWYFEAIAVAQEQGIIMGYENNAFCPDKQISREDAVTLACRAYKIDPLFDSYPEGFKDASSVSDYSLAYIAYATENKILSGYGDNTLRPKNSLSRAEALIVLENFSRLSQTFDEVPYFTEGYPRISNKGKVNTITVEFKANMPCRIYYKAVKKDTSLSYITPKKEEITTYLKYIPNSKTTVTANILLDSYNQDYNLFFIAVSDLGAKSGISKLKDVKALAYSEGDGSKANPYIIYNENQLDYIRYCQNRHFKLANDITLTKKWTPIDASGGDFGSLDGGGHAIYNMNINSKDQNVGFFSVIKNGEIKNLTISGDVTGKTNVGIFAGKSEATTIKGCLASGFVKAISNNAGSFTGINNGVIENSVGACYSVEATANAGGISGSGNGKILKCLSATHSVLSDMYAGGISGINNNGIIRDCVAANINVADFLSYNSGRITTSKESGYTINNYGYVNMTSNDAAVIPDKDSINGEDVSWSDILDKSFYEKILKWDFSSMWAMPDKSKSTFILPLPKSAGDLVLSSGITPYAPKKISTPDGLLNINPEFHYLMTNDIHFDRVWKMPSEDSAFNGSFDGGGFTIYGIELPYDDYTHSYSMFGTIYDGIIRNLNISNVKAEGNDHMAILAVSNYGAIENTTVSGKISAHQVNSSVALGGITAFNYGKIDNCDVKLDLYINASSATVGGISSHNEGFINNVSSTGTINAVGKGISSSFATGGISGFNNEGFIYNAFSNFDININGYTNYTGGISGILNSGEIYKSSSKGKIKTNSNNTAISTSYTGGIAGLSNSGLILNSFTSSDIVTTSTKNYAGGISGYNQEAIIQNTYTINTISQSGTGFLKDEEVAFAGGISGFNERGFISDNVAINPWIISFGASKLISNSPLEFLSNNYAYNPKNQNTQSPENGIFVSLYEIKDREFFTKPIYKGGKLGWSGDKYDGEDAVFLTSGKYSNLYIFPTLNGVKNQQEFITPAELK